VEKNDLIEGCKEEETKEDKDVCKDNAKAMFLALKDKCKAIFEAGMAALDEESEEDMDEESEEDMDEESEEDMDEESEEDMEDNGQEDEDGQDGNDAEEGGD